MNAKEYEIAVVKGDGIGPEVVDETLKVLEEVAGDGLEFRFAEYPCGAGCFLERGTPLPEETVEACRAAAGVVGRPRVYDRRAGGGVHAGLLAGADADAILKSEMDRRYPVASTGTIELRQKTLDNMYNKNMDILKTSVGGSGGGGLTVTNSDGSTSTIGGGEKNVISFATDPKLLKETIADLSSKQSIFGGAANLIGMDTVATNKVLNSLASRIKTASGGQLDDVAVAGILPQLVNSAGDNWIRGSHLDGNIDALAAKGVAMANAEGRTSKGSRTTAKNTGGGSATSGEMSAQLRALDREYQRESKANLASGLRGQYTRQDIESLLAPDPTTPIGKVAVEEDKAASSLFSGTDGISKAMSSTTPGLVQKLYDSNPADFESKYSLLTPKQKKAVDKYVSKDEPIENKVSKVVEKDSSNHTYGVDFQADVNRITKTTGKGTSVVAGIVSNMFDYANKVSTSVDNYFDSEDKSRKPSKPGETVDKMIGNAATSFLNMFDGPAPVDRSPLANMKNGTSPKEDTLKNELIKYTDSFHTKAGQTKAIEDALQMVSGPSGASAKMMRPGVEGKFVAEHVKDLASKGLGAAANKFKLPSMTDIKNAWKSNVVSSAMKRGAAENSKAIDTIKRYLGKDGTLGSKDYTQVINPARKAAEDLGITLEEYVIKVLGKYQ